jgi:hypothetical protein
VAWVASPPRSANISCNRTASGMSIKLALIVQQTFKLMQNNKLVEIINNFIANLFDYLICRLLFSYIDAAV